MSHSPKLILASALFALSLALAPLRADTVPDIRLYTLDCGTLTVYDGTAFFNKGFYPHKSLQMADPCFLVKHPKGWLLWDLGLGDRYQTPVAGTIVHGSTLIVTKSLLGQLQQLGLSSNDIKYIGLSHTHFDHIGNASLFPHATWLLQTKEYLSIQKTPLPPAVDANTFKTLEPMHKILLNGDYDVFGDGTVMILYTPGHTVGHQSLQIKLPHTGIVILAGDLYHTRLSYQYQQMPSFNASRADTLASMSRINRILMNSHGRLIIQHDPGDFSSLPTLPGFLN